VSRTPIGIVVAAVVVAGLAGQALAATGKNIPKKGPASASIVPAGKIEIEGDVAQPTTLKFSELAILPQQTISVVINGVTHTESGPYLESALKLAIPNYLACSKNNLLRWSILVSNTSGAAAVLGVGEVDPGFGNRQAILSISQDGKFLTMQGPRLIVPGDVSGSRDISRVVLVTAAMATPQLPISGCAPQTGAITPMVGSLIVNGAVANPTTYSFAQLQALPQATQTVSFLNGTAPTTNTETGPLLSTILAAAQPTFKSSCPNDELRYYVEITGSDGYASILSYSEIDPNLGNRNPVVSLIENGVSLAKVGPRILQAGDVKGGRAVSGTVAITVFRVPARVPVAGC
jgi:hypothetical protein